MKNDSLKYSSSDFEHLFIRCPYSLYEKRFADGYKFMKVCRDVDESAVYSIEWRDVVVLLQNQVVNRLIIKKIIIYFVSTQIGA